MKLGKCFYLNDSLLLSSVFNYFLILTLFKVIVY